MRLTGKALLAGIVGGFMIISTALADGDHEHDSNEVKYRHSVMEAMGYQFGALAMVFTNRVDRPDDVRVHAQALATTAALTEGLFPAGSEGGQALPLIWEEPDKFAAASRELAEKTAALAKAAEDGDKAAVAKAFKEAGASCKACHERYKEEDE